MTNFKKALSIALLFVLLFFAGCSVQMDYGNVFLVPTVSDLSLIVKTNFKNSKALINSLENFMLGFENEVSTKLENSQLYEFNNSKQENLFVEIGENFYNLTNESKKLNKIGENFNPSLFPLIKLWDLDDFSTSTLSKIPTDKEIGALLPLCKMDNFETKAENGKFYIKKLKADAMLDFGAIAKGYACDKLVEIAKSFDVEKISFDYSGNIQFYNKNKTKNSFSLIQIRNPLKNPSEKPLNLSLKEPELACVTSGIYERKKTFNNIEYSHVLNKFGKHSGEILSATIFNQNGAVADAFATHILCLSLDEAMAFISEQNFKAVLIDKNGKIALNNV